MKRHPTLAGLTLLAVLSVLPSCATQNSPMQQAIAQRVQQSALLGPAAGLVSGASAVVSSPFQDFFSAPLATQPGGAP